MADVDELLEGGGIVLADGAWGTMLRERGLAGSCPELWNADHPEEVGAVARAYAAAGAVVVLTNSFGGNPFKLAAHGLDGRTEELNEAAARISRKAVGPGVAVLASVGPTGVFLEPYGSVPEQAVEQAFRRQIEALLRGGADGVVIETMSDVAEASCAVRAARAAGARSIVVSMTFERKKAGMVTMMGVRPAECAQAFAGDGCSAVGANCGTGIDDMAEVIRAMAHVTSLPLWAKPNAGLPRVIDGATVYPETPEEMAAKLSSLVAAGARIIGGCCGTTPEHIEALREELRRSAV
jgi:5-methyltetrahydrofolate--homocysteine methyltransferase